MMDLPIQYAFMFFNFALAFTYKVAQKSFLKDGNKVNNPAVETQDAIFIKCLLIGETAKR